MLHNLTLIRNATSTSCLRHGIQKVIFICGEIKDFVSDSDKHCAYLEDSDDIDLNGEFDRLSKDEVENLKCKYVYHHVVFFAWLTQAHD
jgi:hypothetical protein